MDRKPKAKHSGPGENPAASVATQVVSLFLAALLQWAMVLVVFPTLHELIHHDADDEHHNCSVTQFLAGQVDQPVLDPIIFTKPALLPVPLDQSYAPRSCGSIFLGCRLLEHAPPLRS
jgi:hypothetical protein